MTKPHFTVDADTWGEVAEAMPKPWPEAMVRADLRYYENEQRRPNPKPFPGRRILEARWGWSERKVRTLLELDDWHDELRPVPREVLLGSRRGAVVPVAVPPPSPSLSPSPNGPTPTIGEKCPAGVPVDVPADVHTRVSSLEPEEPDQPVATGGAPPQPPPPPPAPGTLEVLPEPAKPPTPGRRATDAWVDEWRSALGMPPTSKFPWVWKGRDHDGGRVKLWLSAALVDDADPGPGLDRLRLAIRAYMRAATSRAHWRHKHGEPPSTRAFTADIADWLQVDPAAEPRPPPNAREEPSMGTLLRAVWAS